MRIVFLTSKLNFETSGGSIEEIDFIIKELQSLGNEVTVVTVFSRNNKIPAPLPYKVIEENVRANGLLGIQAAGFKLLRKYENQADFFHIDAHLFMYGAGLYKLLGGKVPIAAFFNMYLICWPQWISSLLPQPKENIFTKIKKSVRWRAEKYVGMPLANQINLFSFVSPTLRAMYEDFGIRHSNNDLVIGDPIDFQKIRRENGIIGDSYIKRNKTSGPITIFFSSRMTPGKGFDILLKGFSKIKNKDNFKLILGGTGSEEKMLHKFSKDIGVSKWVTFTGWVSKEQLYNFYKTADIFIQADWWPAGTSISLIYALAFGVPSILPAGGGLQWNAGKGALYFKYRDTDDLARKIEQLGSNPELRAELSRQCALRLADKDFDYKAHIQNLNSALLILCKQIF